MEPRFTKKIDSGSDVRRVLILDEGSQGHRVQSSGLVKELSKHVHIEQSELEIPFKWPRKFTRTIGKRLLETTFWRMGMKALHPGERLLDGAYDLLVSSGPHSLNFLRYAGRSLNCPTIFVQGSLDVPEGQVDMIVRPYEGFSRRDYVFIPLLFTDVVAGELDDMREAVLKKYKLSEGVRPNVLFVGNSSGKIQFKEADWNRLADGINYSWETTGTPWLVSTSYRTGKSLEQCLRSRIHEAALIKAVWYADNPERVTKEFLAVAGSVYVTVDSLTMATEAVCSERPCFIYCPEGSLDSSNAHTSYMKNLLDQSLVRRADFSSCVSESVAGAHPDYTPAIMEIVKRLQWK